MRKTKKTPYVSSGHVFIGRGIRRPSVLKGRIYIGGSIKKYKKKKTRKHRNRKNQKGAGLGSALAELATGLVNPVVRLFS